MRLKASTGRKLKYGTTSVALTALIIAIVIAVNFIVSMLVQRFTLYADLTPDYHFTISEECYELLGGTSDDSVDTPVEMLDKFRAESGDDSIKVNILFCLERDSLISSATSEYVVRNAEEIATRYPDYITVEFVDARKNPSRVTKYLSSNTETIGFESVIIECGTEYRIRSIESFYLRNESGAPFAYNGEKAFASSIMAVTRAETPVACYTTNHGESFPTSTVPDASGNPIVPFLATLQDAGFKTQALDLSKEEIPEDCRLLVVFDPKQDFLAGNDGVSEVSELDKLDDFLADRNSLMVFMEPTAYEGATGFENLEEFLAEWGLAFRRDGDEPYKIRDTAGSIMGNSSAIVGAYPENPLAEGWTNSMTSGKGSAPQVVFPNATALTYSQSYSARQAQVELEDGTIQYYTIGYKAFNSGVSRTVYDLFNTSTTATAWAGDREMAAATKTNPLKLMAVSVQTYIEQEWNGALEDSSYVMLCGSTDFALDSYLSSGAYGNSDLLLSIAQLSGREPVPVGLKEKEFANFEIKTVTSADATAYIVAFTLVPVIITLVAGVFIIVRRKNR